MLNPTAACKIFFGSSYIRKNINSINHFLICFCRNQYS